MKNLTLLIPFTLLLSTFACFSQTNYTWNGSSSNDWGTAANWTPNGVPGAGDNVTVNNAMRHPVLHQADTVNHLTIINDTLDLDGLKLIVTGKYVFNNSYITAGQLYVEANATNNQIFDSKILAELSLHSSHFQMLDSEFLDSVAIEYAYTGGTGGNGGNVFHDRFYVKHSGWVLFFGNTAPDTFQLGMRIDVVGSGTSSVTIGGNRSGTSINGNVELNVSSTGPYPAINLGRPEYPDSLLVVNGDIIITSTATSYASGVSLFPGVRTTTGSDVSVSEGGFSAGTLRIGLEQEGVDTVDLRNAGGTSVMRFEKCDLLGVAYTPASTATYITTNCVFNQVHFDSVVSWAGARFNGKAELTMGQTVYTGGNVFADSVVISNPMGLSTLGMGYAAPDTFLMPVTFNITDAGSIHVSGNTTGNYFGNGLMVDNRSGNTGKGFYIGTTAYASSTVIDGDIVLNVDSVSGPIQVLRQTTHNGFLAVGSNGFHSSKLTLRYYAQTEDGVMNLSAMDNGADLEVTHGSDITGDILYSGTGSATLTGSIFRGDVDIEAVSLPVAFCDFQGTTSLKKTGAVNNANKGNMFRGVTTLENASSGNYLYWGHNDPDTFLTDLTLINRSTQPHWVGYTTPITIGGDLTLDGDSASVIRFVGTVSGRKLVFNGSTDQHLSILNPDLDVQFYRAEVNKPSGRLKVNNDITVSYELALTDGIVECTNNSAVILKDNVLPTASDSSYVEGAVKKIGNDAFTFPVGSNGHYRPIGISAPSNSTHAFTAQYFNDNVHSVYDTSSAEATISQISTNDYWTLTREVGASNIEVTLSWDDMSCEISDLGELLVAAWDSSSTEWVDYGNGGTTGDSISGTIVSDGTVSDFIAFALATDNSFECVPCQAYAGEDTTLLLLQRYTLGGDSVPGNLYTWTPNQYLDYDTVYNPNLMFPDSLDEDGIYMIQVQVENTQGCVASDEVKVTLVADYPSAVDVNSVSAYGGNFYKICAYMDTLLASSPVDTAEDGEAARYRRWRDFWRSRVDFNDPAHKGDLNRANELYAAAMEDGENVCDENVGTDYLWEPMGELKMATANQGLVPCIWVDKDNPDHVYVGSRSGGIFYTTNFSTNEPVWQCITDLKKLASVGFGQFAVSANEQVIVASSYSEQVGWTNNYNLGVYYTTNAGASWSRSEFPEIDMNYGDIEVQDTYVRKIVIAENSGGGRKIFAITRYRLYCSTDNGATFAPIVFNADDEIVEEWDQYTFQDLELDSRATDGGDSDYENTVWISGIRRFDFTFGTVPITYTIFRPVIHRVDVPTIATATASANLAEDLPNQFAHTNSGWVKIEHLWDSNANAERLFAYYTAETGFDPFTQDIYKSTDDGLSFTNVFSYSGAYKWRDKIRISPDGQRFYIEKHGGTSDRLVWKLEFDQFQIPPWQEKVDNWEYFSYNDPNTHADIRFLLVDWGNSSLTDKIYVGHDGGITVSDGSYVDINGITLHYWKLKNGVGLNNGEYYNVSTQDDEFETSYFAGQDNAVNKFNGTRAIVSWESLMTGPATGFGGDGYELVYSQEGPPFEHSYYKNNNFYSTYEDYPGIVGFQQSVHATRMAVDKDNYLYLGHKEVFKYDFDLSYNNGANQTQLSNFNIIEDLRVVHVPKYFPSTIYAAKEGTSPIDQFRFYKCTNCDDPSDWQDIGTSFTGHTTFESGTSLNQSLPDITQYPLRNYGIFDIATDPNNANKVWISFTGFSENGLARVYKSTDGGVNWIEYSDGLPQFPVSRLIYQEGSNDLVYAATDVGVYYRDASMTAVNGGWKCFSNDLPICVVSDLEIDYCERKLYAATFGRGGWYVDLIEDDTNNELEITTDETWGTDKRFSQLLITVKSGNTLTIDGTFSPNGHIEVKLPKGCKIVVEEGAKMVVENATLTNKCGYMWQGIEVWGDPSEEPDMSTSSPQGILQLNTNAVIENAVLGLYLGKDNNCCNKSGGIVKANGGTGTEVIFRNNRKHVAFGPYQYESESSFLNTDFICSSALQDEEAYPNMGTQQYVSIWGQDGITFTNCNFENTLTGTADEFGPLDRGQGIRAVDAKVNVLATTHSGSTYYSEFKGLTSGIHVSHTIENGSSLRVDDILFENTTQGILSEGSVTDHISSSKFSIPQPEDLSWTIDDWGYGVYMFDGTNHTLNDNIFDSYDTQDIGLRGYISNGAQRVLGPLPVYYITGGLAWKNTFDNILVGTQTEKDNFALSLRCNTYNADNTVDWWLNPESTWGVLGPQGTGCLPDDQYRAGNVFNDTGDEHIFNNATPFNYFYEMSGNQEPDVSSGQNIVNVQGCDPIPGGDPSCDEDPIILNPDYPDTQTALFRIAQQDSTLDVLQAEMDTLKVYQDSSMTDTLLAHIADTNYNKQTLTDELVQYSFLSDTVMNAACSRTPFFTAAQFQDIMVHNSPVSERVWPYLKDALDAMDVKDKAHKDTIIEAQANDTLRTAGAVERDMAVARTQRFGGIATMLNYYTAYDTVPDSTYALIHFLADSLPDKQWNRVAVGVALKADTTSWARSILDSIPKENADDSTFYDYYDLAISLKEDTLTWFDIDSTQRSLVDNIASGTSSVKYRAEAVQMLLDDTVYVRIPEQVPQEPSERRGYQETPEQDLVSESKVTVYPNPFSNEFTVSYTLPDTVNELTFEVFDLTGRLVLSETVSSTYSGKRVLNVGDCKGLYVLRLSADGYMVRSEKLICIYDR